MNTNPIISLLIPVYNQENYINLTIDSIIQQDLEDVEVIFYDDCSTDDSFSIIKNRIEGEEKFKLFKNNYNSGVVLTRRNALRESNGRYIWFVDGGDRIKDNALKYIKSSCNKDVDVIFFNIEEVRGKNYSIIKSTLDDSDPVKEVLLGQMTGSLCTKVFKRDLLVYNKQLDNGELKIGEDYCASLEALLNSNCYDNINLPLYEYLIVDNSATTSARNNRKIVEAINSIKELFTRKNRYNEYREEIELFIYNQLIMNGVILGTERKEVKYCSNKYKEYCIDRKKNKYLKNKNIQFLVAWGKKYLPFQKLIVRIITR